MAVKVTDKVIKKQKKAKEMGTKKDRAKKEHISLKLKLTLSHILIAVLPILIIVIILTTQASSSLLEKVNNSNLAYVSKVTKILDGKLKSIEDVTRLVVSDVEMNKAIGRDAKNYPNAFDMMKDRETNINNKIQTLMFSNNMIRNIIIVQEDENFGNVSVALKEQLKDFYTSELYQRVEASESSSVWFYNLFGTEDIFVMRNIRSIQTAKHIGVLIIQVKKELLIDDLKKDFGGLEDIAILDAAGQVVLVPEDQAELGEIKYFSKIQEQISSSLANNEAPTGTFRTENGVDSEMLVLYGRSANEWIYLLQMPISEVLGDINRIQKLAIMLTLSVVVTAILVGIWMALSISKPIDYIRKKIKLVEQGDLTIQSEYSGKYEIGQLSLSFNHMTSNMKNLLQEVGTVVEKVSTNSKQLNEIALNSALSSKEVMQAVESVTEGATEQAKDAEKTTLIIKELVSQFNATEEHFSFVVKATNKTKEASEDAKKTLETLNSTTSDTIVLSQNIQKDIKNLVNRFHEITSIIGMIDGISEQTNLLALNAAIEAARAGESGKGFAVVADEVRKLAIQSSEAVKSISTIISSINLETTKTEKMIADGATIYVMQEKAVNNTEVIFKEIVSNMDTIMTEVNLVYGLLEGLDEVQVKATDSITSIAAIAQESAAAIEEVLASGQEQMSAADQLVNMSLELGSVIDVMGDQISQFNIVKKQ